MALSITPRQTSIQPPIALYESYAIAGAESTKGDPFVIYVGLTKEQAKELRQKSLDEHDVDLARETSDRTRFGTGSYEAWYTKKERTIFVLVSEDTKTIAALAWAGKEELPPQFNEEGEPHTFAFRSYPPFRGTGIMTDFSRFILATYEHWYPGKVWWLHTNIANEAGKHLYHKLGFTDKGTYKDSECGETLVMVRPKNNGTSKTN